MTNKSTTDERPQRLNLQCIVDTVVDLLQNTSSQGPHSRNVAFLAELFRRPTNIDSLLCSSSLYERARHDSGTLSATTVCDAPATKVEHRLSAKLHSLYGVPVEYLKRTRCKPAYPYAASKVYDLRQYTDQTFWGPFLDDGSQDVDWEKVEAIMVVLGHNLQSFSDRTNGIFEPVWTDPFLGATPNSYLARASPLSKGLSGSPGLDDPYDVTGTWMRVSRNACLVSSHLD